MERCKNDHYVTVGQGLCSVHITMGYGCVVVSNVVCLSLYLSSHFHYCCSSPFVSTRVQVQHAGHVQQGSLVRYIDEFGSNVTGKSIFRDELFLFFSSVYVYIYLYIYCVYIYL